jgi:DNA helicase-2/ATP-dependent DNA helicase PcrA
LSLVGQLHVGPADWPAEFERVRQWYQPHLEQRYSDAMVRAGDLDQLQRIATLYPSRQAFLTDLTLDPPSAAGDEAGLPRLDDDYLILSTIHSAKGQEWKSVFVLNVVDGCIPSDMATGSAQDIEDERRLLYVAMTRAKDRLWLMIPHRFYVQQQARKGDRHLYAARTRFIPAEILGLFERQNWPPPAPPRPAIRSPSHRSICGSVCAARGGGRAPEPPPTRASEKSQWGAASVTAAPVSATHRARRARAHPVPRRGAVDRLDDAIEERCKAEDCQAETGCGPKGHHPT